MSRTFKIVFLACFLIVPLAISWTEDDMDYFPADFTCADSIFNYFAAQFYWIPAEVIWNNLKNAPYEIGYPLLYSILVVLPLIAFLCFLIPSSENLLQQYENEQKRRQTEDESETDEDEEYYIVPEVELGHVTPSESPVLSKSNISIAERLVLAVELHKPELWAPCVVMATPLADERRQEEEVTVAEEFPDLTTVDTADSIMRLKELGETLGARICPESPLGKACVMVAAGAVISYGIYRLFSK